MSTSIVLFGICRIWEKYSVGIEGAKEAGITKDSDLRNTIVQDITHDLRQESVMIFAGHSHSRLPTDNEFEALGRVLDKRIEEIRSVVASLPFFTTDAGLRQRCLC
jgi:hypothetical protein